MVKSRPLENDISPYFEEGVEFCYDGVVDSSVLLGGVRRRQNGLRFFSYTVEKRVDLLDFTVAHKSRGDSELLESSFPTGPVVRSPEVKWRWRFQP